MTAGIKALRKIQLALEATAGSSTAATARLIGKVNMKAEHTDYQPDDLETGNLKSYERSQVVGTIANLPFETDANYEQLGYILGMSIIGAQAPTPTTPSTAPCVWTYTPPLASTSAVNTYTIEYGDDKQAFYSAYCFAKSMELSGSAAGDGDVVKVKADIVGQRVQKTTFTASLSNPSTLNPIVVGTGKLYTGASWAAQGSTQQSNTLIDFSWKLTEGILPVKYCDGNLYFSDRAEKKRHVELDVTCAWNSTAVTLWDAFNVTSTARSLQFIRIGFTGPAITGGNDALNIDGAYIIKDISELQERDGQNIVKLKLVSQKDPTSSSDFSVILTNDKGSLA